MPQRTCHRNRSEWREYARCGGRGSHYRHVVEHARNVGDTCSHTRCHWAVRPPDLAAGFVRARDNVRSVSGPDRNGKPFRSGAARLPAPVGDADLQLRWQSALRRTSRAFPPRRGACAFFVLSPPGRGEPILSARGGFLSGPPCLSRRSSATGSRPYFSEQEAMSFLVGTSGLQAEASLVRSWRGVHDEPRTTQRVVPTSSLFQGQYPAQSGLFSGPPKVATHIPTARPIPLSITPPAAPRPRSASGGTEANREADWVGRVREPCSTRFA